MILHRARRFHRLYDEKTLLQFLDLEGIRIEMLRLQGAQSRPQALLALALLGIIVKSLAVLAAEAALLLHHLDHQLFLRLIDRVGTEIGLGGLHDLEAEIECHLVGQRQRTDRHARHLRSVLDHRRRHAFEQHLIALGDIAQHATIGEEAAGVIDHDRRLADRAHVIERSGQRDVPAILADDDFHQHHLLDRREEMNAEELALLLEFLGQ